MNEDDSPQNALECHDESHVSNGMLVESYRFSFFGKQCLGSQMLY